MFSGSVSIRFVCSGLGQALNAVYAIFSLLCYNGVFGGFSDPMMPTLSGASGDIVTAYAYQVTKGRFLLSLVQVLANGRIRLAALAEQTNAELENLLGESPPIP